MKEYLLGIDLGTSACKVAIFNRAGHVLASGSGDYPVYYGAPGYAEQNPDEWWAAVCSAIQELFTKSGVDAGCIAGVGIDGQSWSAIPIDSSGNVLANTPIWMDTRAQSICDRLNQKAGADSIFQLSGNSLQPSYTTAKILWYKEHMPDVFAKTYKILQSNSFIAFRLTDAITHDFSQGYGVHCFDMRKRVWDMDMCRSMEIPPDFLPELTASHQVIGTVTPTAAAQTGLLAGTPVVAGGLDAACGTLGAGVIHPGETQEQGGQAGGMSICMDTVAADKRLILSCHVVPGQWLLQGGTTGGGGVMRWMEKEFAEYERMLAKETGKPSFIQLNELAEKVNPGSDGVIFLPYMSGERSPLWDADAKGVFYGLDFSKTKGHFFRSAMEGVAFSLKHNLDIAEATGAKANELRAMGGSANSLLWTQIKSDITGKPMIVPSSDTATTLGAAILAGVGVGVYSDFSEAVTETVKITRTHEPNMKNHALYQTNFQTYLALYQNLKEIMHS